MFSPSWRVRLYLCGMRSRAKVELYIVRRRRISTYTPPTSVISFSKVHSRATYRFISREPPQIKPWCELRHYRRKATYYEWRQNTNFIEKTYGQTSNTFKVRARKRHLSLSLAIEANGMFVETIVLRIASVVGPGAKRYHIAT